MQKIFSKNNLNFILPIISGALLAMSVLFDFGGLIWMSLVPLFYFLALKSTSHKKAFIGGWITGFMFLGALFSWLFETAPFEWLGIKDEKSLVAMFFLFLLLWIIQTAFLGLFVGLFSVAVKKIMSSKLNNFVWALILLPSAWIISEYLRAWSFNVLWLGKEVLWGPHWTFGNLAYFLHNNHTLIQIADIGGIYLISFLIVLINTIIFLLINGYRNKKITKFYIIISIILVIIIFTGWRIYGIYKLESSENGSKTKLALLQTNFASSNEFNSYQKQDIFETLKNLFQKPENINQNSDIIIAPEGFGIVAISGNTEIAKYLLKDFWQPGQLFLENRKFIDENQKTKSRLFYYDLDKKQPIAFYDKMLMVPNGDYLPYLTRFLLNIYSFNFGFEQRFFQRGEKSYVAETPKGKIGGNICSGILSPGLNRQMAKDGAEILISISSDAPFHGAKTLLTQNLAMSQFRAVENRRYFAQATNMGYSFLLNSKGEIIIKSSQFGNQIIFSEAALLNEKTVYVKFGDWMIIVAGLILLLWIIGFMVINKKRVLDT